MQTAERSSSHDPSEQVIYFRCLFAYEAAKSLITGDVLELGSGEGYGVKLLAPLAKTYLATDKFESSYPGFSNVQFSKMRFPSLAGIPDNSFDVALSFQVLEHIRNDNLFVKEIHRVLKTGGLLLLSTPNRKMSLTRNPWHIREYTSEELDALIGKHFASVQIKGVFGSPIVMDYYEQNKTSVAKFSRYDLFKMQQWLPRQLLQIPYNILNRVNRRKLLKSSKETVSTVNMTDFILKDSVECCFDLFVVARK